MTPRDRGAAVHWFVVGITAVAITVMACGRPSDAGVSGAPTAPTPRATELTVFAAASLRRAVEAAGSAYETARPGTTIALATDSSAALATQIEQGAPADVFLSADLETADRLVAGGHAAGQPVVFAANGLAVIVPSGNPSGLDSPADLARPGLTIIAAAPDVPISRYAARLLESLAREPGYPADLAAAYEANVATREDNVAAVVTKIELGEGDAAIVYRTDAAASTSVEAIPVPEAANIRVDYAGLVVDPSRHPVEAAAFLEWLAGPDGQRILAGFEFGPVTP